LKSCHCHHQHALKMSQAFSYFFGNDIVNLLLAYYTPLLARVQFGWAARLVIWICTWGDISSVHLAHLFSPRLQLPTHTRGKLPVHKWMPIWLRGSIVHGDVALSNSKSFCLVVKSWLHCLDLESLQSPLNWWLALTT
jgi:hypothetical protein